jgi:hypothetical protein
MSTKISVKYHSERAAPDSVSTESASILTKSSCISRYAVFRLRQPVRQNFPEAVPAPSRSDCPTIGPANSVSSRAKSAEATWEIQD